MALKAFWKGYLKLSLVTCPVAMTPATSESERIRFHTLNRTTGNRIVSEYVDSVTGKPVDSDDEVKGYERGEDDHVMLEDDELDAVALETTHTIDIEMFCPRDSVGWIWYDKPHYLVPNDKVGAEAFAVIREAMAATDVVGISRLVLYRRERAVLLEPRDNGIVLWTLRYGDEVRDAADYFAGLEPAKPDPKLMRLMGSLIEERTKSWSADFVDDPVQARLLELINSKKKKGAKKVAKPKAEPQPETGNVINIMDALRNSIASSKAKAKPR
ncbi:Ku protein [Methylopila turkensis]|uniref:Non-homologous end joining protein Ku n=1 Tax=Methylopila turkensis TaxID=1437816 RepID=A0A9W6JJR6_9HYPH|nr:Ku protein [Methylopila turkensis]GLK78961.1 non-homologous end joining protein Ku [Methylopila turkensis]